MKKMKYTKEHMDILAEYFGRIKVTKKNQIQLNALATFVRIHADIVEVLCAIQNTLNSINDTLSKKKGEK